MAETKEQKVTRLAEQSVESAIGRRGFTITKFSRHPELRYFHARVTMSGERTIYVHCRYGSWMAPGTVGGRAVMKELEALGIPFDAKVELCRKARLVERAEREAALREEAVRIVDQRHGYTAETAPDPDKHRAEYEEEVTRLRNTKGPKNGNDTKAVGTTDSEADATDLRTGGDQERVA